MSDEIYEVKLREAKMKLETLGKDYPDCLFIMIEKKGLTEFPYKNVKDICDYLEWEYNKLL